MIFQQNNSLIKIAISVLLVLATFIYLPVFLLPLLVLLYFVFYNNVNSEKIKAGKDMLHKTIKELLLPTTPIYRLKFFEINIITTVISIFLIGGGYTILIVLMIITLGGGSMMRDLLSQMGVFSFLVALFASYIISINFIRRIYSIIFNKILSVILFIMILTVCVITGIIIGIITAKTLDATFIKSIIIAVFLTITSFGTVINFIPAKQN